MTRVSFLLIAATAGGQSAAQASLHTAEFAFIGPPQKVV
jgi:hypothetical protein